MRKVAFDLSDNLIKASSSYAGPSVLSRHIFAYFLLQLKKCQTLEDLGKHFEEKLTRINQTFVLRNGCDEDKERCQQLLTSLAFNLSELQTILTVMKAELSQRKRALDNVNVSRKK